MSDEKVSFMEKVLFVLTAIGGVFASVFYLLYKNEKGKSQVLENKNEISQAEAKAKEVAKEKNEKCKNEGSTGIASDSANILDE